MLTMAIVHFLLIIYAALLVGVFTAIMNALYVAYLVSCYRTLNSWLVFFYAVFMVVHIIFGLSAIAYFYTGLQILWVILHYVIYGVGASLTARYLYSYKMTKEVERADEGLEEHL